MEVYLLYTDGKRRTCYMREVNAKFDRVTNRRLENIENEF